MKKNFVKLILFSFFLTVINSVNAYAAQLEIYTPGGYKQLASLNTYDRVVEILLDYSGSMTGKIPLVLETVKTVIPAISSDTLLALRIFGYVPPEVTGFDMETFCNASTLITYFANNNQDKVVSGLSKVKAGGQTPLETALRDVVNKDFPSAGRQNKKIILLTDGCDTCGGSPCRYIKYLVTTRKDIKIDVINFGSCNLKCIADVTGGKYYMLKAEYKEQNMPLICRACQDTNTNDNYKDFVNQFENVLEESIGLPKGTIDKLKNEKNNNKNISNPDADVKSKKDTGFESKQKKKYIEIEKNREKPLGLEINKKGSPEDKVLEINKKSPKGYKFYKY